MTEYKIGQIEYCYIWLAIRELHALLFSNADQMETSSSLGEARAFDYCMCPGSWQFDGQGLSRGGDFDLCVGGVGKIEPERSGSNFFWTRRSLTAINTCLDDMKE